MLVTRIRLPGHPSAVGTARRTIERLAGMLDEPSLEDLRLLVSEVVTNSIRHSRVRADRECIGLSIYESHNAFRVEVEDPGPGFSPRVLPPSEAQFGGWGLYLVDRLSADWGVGYEGTTKVWFTVPRTAGHRAG